MGKSIDNSGPLALRMLDALPQSVLLADSTGRIVMRNAASRRMLPKGNNIANVVKVQAAPLDWSRELELLSEGGGTSSHQSLVVEGTGRRQLTVDVQLVSLDWTDQLSPAAKAKTRRHKAKDPGSPGACTAANDGRRGTRMERLTLVVVTDVSHRVTMERRLLASERLASVGELSAKVAHEINNPLDGVLRYVGMAMRQPAAAADYLAKAKAGLLRMAQVVQGLLEQGHPRQGRFSAGMEKLLQEALTAMQPRAQAQSVALLLDLRDPQAWGDGNLFQVFCNIIKNSLDAMPRGGLLIVRQFTEGDRSVIEFSDTGSGIDSADAEKIFEPFYTTKAAGSGSGLGLAICRQIVSRLGGRISAAPRFEGGTVITINLPLKKDPSGAAGGTCCPAPQEEQS